MNEGQPHLDLANPYAAPMGAGAQHTDFVKVQLSRLRTRELARLLLPNLPAMLFALGAKYTGQSLCSRLGHDPHRWRVLERSQIQQRTAGGLDEHFLELTRSGQAFVFAYEIPCVGDWNGCVAVFGDAQGRYWSTCTWLRTSGRLRRFYTIGSFLKNGSLLLTTNAVRAIDPPPHIRAAYLTRRTLETLLATHQDRLSHQHESELHRWSKAELPALLKQSAARCLDHYLARQVWIRMSHDEVVRQGTPG